MDKNSPQLSDPKQTDLKEKRRKERQKWINTITMVLGYPSGGFGLAFTGYLLKTGQWPLAILSGLASIGVIGLAVFAKFVSNFFDNIIDKIDARLEELVEPFSTLVVSELEAFIVKTWWKLTANFKGKYYQYFIYICRDYKTQGLKTKGPFTLDLETVFVPLKIAPESDYNASGQMIRSLSSQNENYQIWDVLAARKQQPIYRCLAIIGTPGTGKSTLLEHLALTYAKNHQKKQHQKAPKLFPILLYLRSLKDKISEAISSENSQNKIPLSKFIEQQEAIQDLNPRSQWFEEQLKNNNCLVMLDGLDEVADLSQRKAVSQWINQQIKNYPKAQFIVTSRPYGYEQAPIDNITTIFEVKPFNLTQMRQFIDNWYLQKEIMSRLGKDDPGVRQVAKNQATDLIKRIQNNAPLASMAINPLLLTMIATVHCYRGALPGRRVELYQEICDVLLGRRQEAKGIEENLTPRQKKIVLQVLAFELMKQKTRSFSPKQGSEIIRDKLIEIGGNIQPLIFLENIENLSGLIFEKEKDVYEFSHLSFQEYLAACQSKESQAKDLLLSHYQDSWWTETIRLYAAETEGTPILEIALENPHSVEALKLALDCCNPTEKLIINSQIKSRFEKQLQDNLTPIMFERFEITVKAIPEAGKRQKNSFKLSIKYR